MTPAGTILVSLQDGCTQRTITVRGIDLAELESVITAGLYRRGWYRCERCSAMTPAVSLTGRWVLCPVCESEGELFLPP